METTIKYKNRGGESDALYKHPYNPLLYRTDTVTQLTDCPFPLKTDSFTVLAFGDVEPHTADPGSTKFTIVEYTKRCGHTVQERINFIEGVQDFDHYGTKFTGKSYSIKDWKNRIEYFRGCLCDVCALASHVKWARLHAEECVTSKKKAIKRFLLLMNANYKNWQEFITLEQFAASLEDDKLA